MWADHKDTLSVFEKDHIIQEVVVTSRSAKERIDQTQIGQQKIDLAQLARVPSLFGEKDIFRAIQLLPGVKSEGESSSGFQVRGGTSSQNQILLDKTSIYQAGHLMGIFSTFNDDALSNASLFKGMIPEQYGGATSSVLSIDTRPGNMDKLHYGGTIGLLSAKIFAEGPIKKDVASFLVSARRSYADLFMQSGAMKDSKFHFYDVNARLDWRISTNDRLSLSLLNGNDVLGMADVMDMNWGNTSLSGRWIHYFSDRLISNMTLYYSNFDNYMGIEAMGTTFDQNGFIRHMGVNYILNGYIGSNLKWNAGYQSDYTWLRSAEWTIGNTTERSQNNAWDNSLWAGGEWKPWQKFAISAGLRASFFSPEHQTVYPTIEPRFSANYKLNDDHSIKLGYTRASQNIHAVMSNATSMPFNRYAMSTDIIKPEVSDQISLGYYGKTHDGAFDFSVEGYYKLTDHVYDYMDGKNFRSDISIDKIVLGGESKSYGMEFAAHKNHGRFTGWISYTLSWVKNKIDGINNGEWYRASNDRRHDISVVGMYKLNKKWDMSASWKYNTGQALTAPSAKYIMADKMQYYYAERNGYRAPDYHRLDVSFNRTSVHENYTTQWSFGVYNIYAHSNPFMIMFKDDPTKSSGIKTSQISLLNFIPSVSFSIKY